MPHQDPDDFQVSPIRFRTYDPDGTIENTFLIRNPWHLTSTKAIGQLMVRECRGGIQLVKILWEGE